MEFKKERDYEFFKACEVIRKESKEYISVSEIARLAIETKASSFFLSEREIGKIIQEKRDHVPKSKAKAELYWMIRRRYRQIKANYPNMRIGNIIKHIALSGAPRFYITESSARDLYYQLLKHSPGKKI